MVCMWILVSRLVILSLVILVEGLIKGKLCIHKPCSTGQQYSTGHQTGFVVRINCVRTRQEISKHIPIAYNMLY